MILASEGRKALEVTLCADAAETEFSSELLSFTPCEQKYPCYLYPNVTKYNITVLRTDALS